MVITTISTDVTTTQFGANISAARENKKLTQTKVAEELGKSGHTAIVNWEKGTSTPRLGDLVKLCNLLEVTPNDLLGFNQEK